MHYLWQHIHTLISTYNGSVPLTHFLKNYCRQYPILGSRDRKMLSNILYCWYRCSRGITFGPESGAFDLPNTVRTCLEICNTPMELYARLFAAVPPPVAPPFFDISRIFPYNVSLSAGISKENWLQSMLVQPDLFIRIRRDKDKICALLDSKQISYNFITPSCLALPNGTAVDTLLPPASYVVQDASSQQTGEYFTPSAGQQWYDCCSGAGGKSLLLMDKGVPVNLTVTDKRDSILHNLKERFRLYGHKLPVSYVADAANSSQLDSTLKGATFDNIICDVPCSGSGTWARTPEQLYFFKEDTPAQYADLQTKIAINVSRHLKKGGKLIYITCSVFRKENEDVVNKVISNTGLRLSAQTLINGTAIKADSMFISVLE